MNSPASRPQRPPFTVEHRGNGHRQKTAMPKWSHQQELERLIGKEITLILDNGGGNEDRTSGMLTAADAFTVQLAQKDRSVVTYFKHSIRGYAKIATS